MHWNAKRDFQKPSKPIKCLPVENAYGCGYATLNRLVLSWRLKLEMVVWEVTFSGSLFHSTGTAVAK